MKLKIKKDTRGGYRPGAGSKPGIKKKKTLEWEAFGKTVLEKGMPRFIKIMKDTDDEEFAKIFLQILEYFKPKLARTELSDPDKMLSRPVIVLPELIEDLNKNNDKTKTDTADKN